MRGRQVVWSDPRIQQLSREFVAVADEVYMLYPEDAGNLARVADDPAHLFFKRYGESMPAGDWHHPGTKQGIYMMGPQGEYLEGRFAASGDPDDVLARMQRALARWQTLRAARGYANEPVPPARAEAPPEHAGKPLLLRVSLRDLAPGARPGTTARWRPGAFPDAQWQSWLQWAWNQNWYGVDDPAAFVTTSARAQPVAPAAFRRLARAVLVDNVRGQAPEWREQHVVVAELTMRRLVAAGTWTIEYSGRVRMDAGEQEIDLRLHGEGEWDPAAKRFVRFDLVALGERRGAWPFHQRREQPGPSPLGIVLQLAPATAPAATTPARAR